MDSADSKGFQPSVWVVEQKSRSANSICHKAPHGEVSLPFLILCVTSACILHSMVDARPRSILVIDRWRKKETYDERYDK